MGKSSDSIFLRLSFSYDELVYLHSLYLHQCKPDLSEEYFLSFLHDLIWDGAHSFEESLFPPFGGGFVDCK